jgi:hypothetical protein
MAFRTAYTNARAHQASHPIGQSPTCTSLFNLGEWPIAKQLAEYLAAAALLCRSPLAYDHINTRSVETVILEVMNDVIFTVDEQSCCIVYARFIRYAQSCQSWHYFSDFN